MMSRLFRAPRPAWLFLAILLVSLLTGYLANLALLEARAGLLGLVAFALPVVIAVLLTKPLAEALGGKMYLRRSALLGLIGLGLVLLAALAALLVPGASMVRYLLVGWASTLWVRQAVLMALSQSSPLRSLPAVVIQPLLGFAVLPFFFTSMTAGDWLVGLLASAAFYAGGLVFTLTAVIPLERAAGVDGLGMMRYSIDHMTEKGDEGTEEMEASFATFANRVTVPAGLLSVEREGGRPAVLVVASLHPGPYGRLGGSDLPTKLRDGLAMEADLLVPHGPSTHDQNPATSKEVAKLTTWVREALPEVAPRDRASPFVRVTRKGVSVGCQIFDATALLVATRAPEPTDDIDFATGYAALAAAREAGVRSAILADAHNSIAHNSIAPGSGAMVFGSEESYALLEATREAVKKAQARVGSGLRVGVASNQDLVDPDRGLGPSGIQAFVAEVDGQRTAYLLFDGNNMVPDLREKLLGSIEDLVDEAEVLTTDNHIVNNTLPGFNPVGWRTDHEALGGATRSVVKEALSSLVAASVGGHTGLLEDVAVWGHQTAVRLMTAISSSLATIRINAGVTFLLAAAISVLGLALIP
jgi:putative membrane protein